MVGGHQLTVAFHVDDLKISHVDNQVIDNFIARVKEKYEDQSIKMIVPSVGKVHDFLGMTLDFSVEGKVKVLMKDYIENMLNDFPYIEEVNTLKQVKTPAAEYLFVIDDQAVKFGEQKKTRSTQLR
jgi:uncharacterized protein with ATP-grasp and redox domains